MKIHALQPGEGIRLALAVLAGLLLAGSFPKIGIAGFAWIAPGLILGMGAGLEGRRAFRIGYVAGFSHFLASLYWLLNIPMNKVAPITAWLLLSAYLALFPGMWVWLCWRLYAGGSLQRQGGTWLAPGADAEGTRTSAWHRVSGEWRLICQRFLETRWLQRMSWALLCAALWVSLEMAQARLFSGFPWNFLGVSQYRMLPVIQIASWGGVYAVSFLVAWASVSLWCGAMMVLGRPQNSRRWMGEIILPMGAGAAAVIGGLQLLFIPALPAATLKVVLVQPSIPQTTIWDPAEGAKRFRELLALSEVALTNHPDLLVWPEAAAPSLLRWETNRDNGTTMFEAVTQLARRHGVWLVLGADDAEPDRTGAGGALFYNSSFLISPAGEIAGVYRKRRLVIFGEYVPLARWLPFLREFTGIGSDFTPGDAPVQFQLGERRARTSVLICFEDIFPHFVREYVEDETDFLLNLTNNGWFGESAAQWQHAANAVFRAVENGVPLVRCANNGLTCVVDAQGRMEEVFFPGTRDIYGAGFKVAQVPLRAGTVHGPTLYRRHGDWFGWSCVALGALATALSFVAPRSRSAGFPTRSGNED